MASLEQARAAREGLAELLVSLPQLNGIGVARSGRGWAVKVNLSEPVPRGRVPLEFEGVPVRVEVIGPITKS
jgi:hypothetical protein